MLRAGLDQIIAHRSSSIVLVLAHAGALMWAAGLRKGIAPALVLNCVTAAGIIAYNAQAFGLMLANGDWTLLALVAFALATLLGSAAALYGLKIPVWIVWTAFTINFALSVLLMAFLFLFKMNRLF